MKYRQRALGEMEYGVPFRAYGPDGSDAIRVKPDASHDRSKDGFSWVIYDGKWLRQIRNSALVYPVGDDGRPIQDMVIKQARDLAPGTKVMLFGKPHTVVRTESFGTGLLDQRHEVFRVTDSTELEVLDD